MFLLRIALLIVVAATAIPAIAEDGVTNWTLWQLLKQKNFAELDAKLSALQQTYERDFRTGEYVERDLSRAMRVFYVTDETIGPALDEWVAKMPRSYVAALAHGEHLVVVARKRRTGKFANQVKPEQWAAAREVAARAVAELERSLTLTERPILSYAYLIEIADLYVGAKDKDQLLAAANRLDRRNYYPNSEYLVRLTPRWGGSVSEMTDFVAQYRTRNATKWKGDCLEAHLLDEQASGYGKGPNQQATAQQVAFQDRSIELCPRWDRYATRGTLHYSRGDLALAEKDFRSALQLDPWASYGSRARLGALLQNRGAYDEAVGLCREAAAGLQPVAMRCLSWAYFNGKGIEKNDKEALQLLQKCVALDDPGCKSALAYHYWDGAGIAQDKAQATKLWREAAADSDGEAASKLRELGLSQK